jgi:hypothetical protein
VWVEKSKSTEKTMTLITGKNVATQYPLYIGIVKTISTIHGAGSKRPRNVKKARRAHFQNWPR